MVDMESLYFTQLICSCDNLTGDVRVSNYRQWQTSVIFQIRSSRRSV